MKSASRYRHLAGKAWKYLLALAEQPFQFPSTLLHLAKGAHLGTLLTLRDSWIRHAKIRTIIDVGAHAGEFALTARALLPQARIYSFEPLPGGCRALRRKMRGDAAHTTFEVALGDESGEATFYRNDFSKSSSLLPMLRLHKEAFPWTTGETPLQVRVARLDDFLGELTLTPETLLKVDVQGFEDRVLRGAARVLPQVQYVLVEVSFRPLYEGQALFSDVNTFLAEAGFRYAGNVDQLLSPLDNTVLQADALFVAVR